MCALANHRIWSQHTWQPNRKQCQAVTKCVSHSHQEAEENNKKKKKKQIQHRLDFCLVFSERERESRHSMSRCNNQCQCFRLRGQRKARFWKFKIPLTHHRTLTLDRLIPPVKTFSGQMPRSSMLCDFENPWKCVGANHEEPICQANQKHNA